MEGMTVLQNTKNNNLNEFIIKEKCGDERMPHILGESHCIIEMCTRVQ